MRPLAVYLLARARERSTWLGLFAMLGAVGVQVPEPTVQAIASGAIALAGMLGAALPDRPTPSPAAPPALGSGSVQPIANNLG